MGRAGPPIVLIPRAPVGLITSRPGARRICCQRDRVRLRSATTAPCRAGEQALAHAVAACRPRCPCCADPGRVDVIPSVDVTVLLVVLGSVAASSSSWGRWSWSHRGAPPRPLISREERENWRMPRRPARKADMVGRRRAPCTRWPATSCSDRPAPRQAVELAASVRQHSFRTVTGH